MAQNEVEVDVGGGGKGGLSMGKIVVILVAIQFMLVVVLGAALYFAGVFDSGSDGDSGGEQQQATEDRSMPVGDPAYVKMEPPFTVNFSSRGGARFMQVTIELMTYDKEAQAAIEKHNPVLRSRILRTLGGKEEEEVRTVEGKDQLQQEVLDAVRAVMADRYGKEAIEEVYFTSFVIQ